MDRAVPAPPYTTAPTITITPVDFASACLGRELLLARKPVSWVLTNCNVFIKTSEFFLPAAWMGMRERLAYKLSERTVRYKDPRTTSTSGRSECCALRSCIVDYFRLYRCPLTFAPQMLMITISHSVEKTVYGASVEFNDCSRTTIVLAMISECCQLALKDTSRSCSGLRQYVSHRHTHRSCCRPLYSRQFWTSNTP